MIAYKKVGNDYFIIYTVYYYKLILMSADTLAIKQSMNNHYVRLGLWSREYRETYLPTYFNIIKVKTTTLGLLSQQNKFLNQII